MFIGTTIYGKGDSAIGFSPLEHKREEELKGYKINITWTNDLFKKKNSIYLEGVELIRTMGFLLGQINEVNCKRGAQQSGQNKSIKFLRSNGKIYVNVDVQGGIKHGFTIDELDKIIIYKMILTTIQKEIYRSSGVKMNELEIEKYVEKLAEKNTTNIIINENTESQAIESSDYVKIWFMNSYNNKEYKNELEVKKDFIDKIKAKNTIVKELTEDRKNDLIIAIRNNLSEGFKDKGKFLTLKNVDSLYFN